MAVGVFQLGGYFALAHEAVAWVPAGRTAILANTTTIWVVPLSLIFLHERIPLRRWIAAGLGLAGVVVLMSPWAIDWTSRNVLVGHAFLLGASLSWSVAIIVTRAARPHLSMFELLPWCFAVAAVMLAPLLMWHAPDGTLGSQPGSWAGAGLYRTARRPVRNLVRGAGDRDVAHCGLVGRLPDDAGGQPDPGQSDFWARRSLPICCSGRR